MYTHNGMLFGRKRMESLFSITWIKLEVLFLVKKDRERQIFILFRYQFSVESNIKTTK